MADISSTNLNRANKEAVLNVYSYLADKADVRDGATFSEVVSALEKKSGGFNDAEKGQLSVLQNAINSDKSLGKLVIGDQIKTGSGLNACTVTDSKGNVSVVFRGTGDGEWIDNGEGLTGVPEANNYHTYDSHGNIVSTKTVANDYASDQQADALNWFNKTAAKNGWDKSTPITVSGHSKGGNKAQFITMKSDLVDRCYSFDGQGFSPEAIKQFKSELGPDFEKYRHKMYSLSADNDYVNVLGNRLVPSENTYFFESRPVGISVQNYHCMETMLDKNGRLNMQVEQGILSNYVQSTCDDIMDMPPSLRKNVTLGVMNVCQEFLGEGTPVNGDKVDFLTLAVGIATAGLLISDTAERTVIQAIAKNWADKHKRIIAESGIVSKAESMLVSFAELAFVSPFIAFVDKKSDYKDSILSAISYFDRGIRDASSKIHASLQGFFKTVYNNVSAFFAKSYNVKRENVYSDSVVKINTSVFYNMSNDVRLASTIIEEVQIRLQELYNVVGLQDIYNILEMPFFDNYKKLLANNRRYLTDTANEFESAENAVNNLF